MSLLPGLTQSAPGVPIFAPASGGGGGGGGPNPAFSTIAFPPAVPTPSGPTAGGILMSQQLIIDDLATAIAGDFAFTAALPYANGLAGATSTTAFTIFAPQNGCSLALGCGEDEVIYIDGAAGGGDPGVAVRGVGNVSISSMTISSINGAVPGGGGGGTASTISTFTNLNVSSGTVALGGTLSISGQDPNLYQFTVFDSNVSSIAALSLGTVGGRNQFNTAIGEIPAFYTSTITGTTGVIQLNPTGTEQIRIGGLGAPGDITLNTVGGGSIILNGAASAPITASISSLTVSSINGAAPSGGGVSVSKLSWLNSGTNTLPANGTPGTFVTLTNSSPAAINGHTYRVTASFLLSNSAPDGATVIVIDGAGIGGLPALIYQAPNVSTVTAAGAGYCGYFTVAGNSGSGFTVSGVNTGSQATVIDGDAAFVLVEDLGAI